MRRVSDSNYMGRWPQPYRLLTALHSDFTRQSVVACGMVHLQFARRVAKYTLLQPSSTCVYVESGFTTLLWRPLVVVCFWNRRGIPPEVVVALGHGGLCADAVNTTESSKILPTELLCW